HRVSHQSTATIAATAAAVPEARPMRAYHQRLTGAPPGSGRRSTPWPGRRSGRWSRRVRARRSSGPSRRHPLIATQGRVVPVRGVRPPLRIVLDVALVVVEVVGWPGVAGALTIPDAHGAPPPRTRQRSR